MRIGFDVSQTGARMAGCGQVADRLIVELAELSRDDEFLLYPTFGDHYWDPDWAHATRTIDRPNVRRGLAHATHAEAQAFWTQPSGDFECQLGEPDVVHSHNFFCPVGLKKARLVYTVHDLSFLVHPEWSTESNRQACFRGVFDASLYADRVVAVSEHSRRHFLETFPHVPEEKTAVMPLASRFGDGPVARPEALADLSEDEFLLSVGTLEPRKNPQRLLRAYAAYAQRRSDPRPLVLAGGQGWKTDLEQEIAALGIEPHVHLRGFVDDDALAWLYRSCRAFLYPSLFEGFGLPVVEALSQGAAVLTSRATSLPEVAGDAAVLVDPTDEGELSEAIETLSEDDGARDALRGRAKAQASRFSWRKTAEDLLDLYRAL